MSSQSGNGSQQNTAMGTLKQKNARTVSELERIPYLPQVYAIPIEQREKESKLLEENVTWAGDGEDSACSPFSDDHRFELQVEELREETITGRLILTHNGETEHDTTFTGRGFKKNGKFYYEVKLDTPRHVKNIIQIDIDKLWLIYDPVADTFTNGEIVGYYDMVMTRQK